MSRYTIIFMLFVFPFHVFAQQGATSLRDYVGLINQSYHPRIESYFGKARDELAKQNETDVVEMIDMILKGGFGSGFLYSDDNGKLYVITNNHVVAQAHNVSITFERVNGAKTRIDNLRIIALDEENDLALLEIPEGETLPVTQGLPFITRDIVEGEEVFSAGFPGLGMTPLWQFGNGRVSNSYARFPRSRDDETLMGPFIQHTAQVDEGNSGGPLLVPQESSSGYAVAGINSLSGIRRQAANYAIPVGVITPFIENALNPKPETFRSALDERLNKFIEGLAGNRAAYPQIAKFLSTECIGENVEYAFEEMFEKASRSVLTSFIQEASDDFIGAMSIAVAWTIEDSIRSNTGGTLRASVKEVSGGNEEYTVVFMINSREVSSVWMREYGNWRIKTFGTVAAGDKTLVEQRQARREKSANLRTDGNVFVEAGFATLFEKAPAAFYASIEVLNIGFNFYLAEGFWNLGVSYGFNIPFQAGDFGFIPYIRAGVNISHESDNDDNILMSAFIPVSIMLRAGLKVTTSWVPGLYLGVNFQYNVFSLIDNNKRMKMGLAFTAGYTF